MDDTRIVVYRSLKYVDEITPAVVDRVFEGMNSKDIARNLLSNMRTVLSVPAMFATMRVLRRLQQIIDTAAKAHDAGDVVYDASDMKKNNVNYTVLCIYRSIVFRLQTKFGNRLETMQIEFNPYRDISDALDSIIAYVARKQFGIKIN